MQKPDSTTETLFERLDREIDEKRVKKLDFQPEQTPHSTFNNEQLKKLKEVAARHRDRTQQQQH